MGPRASPSSPTTRTLPGVPGSTGSSTASSPMSGSCQRRCPRRRSLPQAPGMARTNSGSRATGGRARRGGFRTATSSSSMRWTPMSNWRLGQRRESCCGRWKAIFWRGPTHGDVPEKIRGTGPYSSDLSELPMGVWRNWKRLLSAGSTTVAFWVRKTL